MRLHSSVTRAENTMPAETIVFEAGKFLIEAFASLAKMSGFYNNVAFIQLFELDWHRLRV